MKSRTIYFIALYLIVAIIAMLSYGLSLRKNAVVSKDKVKLKSSSDTLHRPSKKSEFHINTPEIALKDSAINALRDSLEKMKQKESEAPMAADKVVLSKEVNKTSKTRQKNSEFLRIQPREVKLNDIPHRYGKGNGRVVFYKDCRCKDLSIWIDGKFVGVVSERYEGEGLPKEIEEGMVAQTLSAGNHSYYGEDNHGRVWKGELQIIEDRCLFRCLHK